MAKIPSEQGPVGHPDRAQIDRLLNKVDEALTLADTLELQMVALDLNNARERLLRTVESDSDHN